MFSHVPDAGIHRILSGRIHAVLQMERTAVRHCQREAERMMGTAPAGAMQAIGAHARDTLGALILVCVRDGLRTGSNAGRGEAWLELLHDRVEALWSRSERSYRDTLRHIRCGVDLMQMVALSAGAASKHGLAEFCATWLPRRRGLLELAEEELLWFARNPEKGSDQRWLGERYGRAERGPALHPFARETGSKGASNVGDDETSGSE